MSATTHGGDALVVARRRRVSPSAILDFSANINPLGLPSKARARLKRELSLACSYPDRHQEELRALVASTERVDPDCILFGNGATQLIHLIARSFRPKTGLVAEPSFSEYRAALLCSGCAVKELRLCPEKRFRFDVDQFMDALERERPELAIVGNPNNPTGCTVPRKDLLGVVRAFASRRKCLVVDESFIDFTRHPSLVTLAARRHGLIVLRSFTKFFAIPGLRIGYLVGHRSVVRRLDGQLEPWSVNALALVAASESIQDSWYRERTIALIKRERRYLSDALAALEWLEPQPSEANFLLARINAKGFHGSELRQRLEKENIVIRDATGFRNLGSQYVRIAIRSRQENRSLVAALKAIGAELSRTRSKSHVRA